MKISAFMSLVLSVVCAAALIAGEDAVRLEASKITQLKRLEPLTADKVEVFREAGQLTRAQAEFVKKHINAKGELELPAVTAERPALGARDERPAPPREAGAKPRKDPYADFKYMMSEADQEKLEGLIRAYRRGNRPAIGRELRDHRPEVNQLIARAYTDPIDLHVKLALWEEVAGPANPDAAVGLFDTHYLAWEFARPVLIAYDKDAGGILVRRRKGTREEIDLHPQRFFTSRELRDIIIDTEGMIARCTGPSAAIFLMGVYSERYVDGPVPMRDKGRDRHRLVEACGGSPKKFDQDEPDSWTSTLKPGDRAAIADALIPWLHRGESDRRQIARNGLMVCLGDDRHPDWDASASAWQKWWEERKNDMK